MSEAEKRSVHTDALATLGTIINESEKRDAIHLAVEPTKAAEKLYPGQDVGVDGSRNNPVGIVDPFLKAPIMPGDWFWLVVYPRQINSLRHVWTHPAFIDEPQLSSTNVSASESWLKTFCGTNDAPSYESLIEAAKNDFDGSGGDADGYGSIRDEGDYLISYGSDAHCEIPAEFWVHLENVTGRKFKSRPTYFSCSC